MFLLGQNLVLIGRGGCKNWPQFSGSIIGFVGNSLIVIFLVSLLLIPEMSTNTWTAVGKH